MASTSQQPVGELVQGTGFSNPPLPDSHWWPRHLYRGPRLSQHCSLLLLHREPSLGPYQCLPKPVMSLCPFQILQPFQVRHFYQWQFQAKSAWQAQFYSPDPPEIRGSVITKSHIGIHLILASPPLKLRERSSWAPTSAECPVTSDLLQIWAQRSELGWQNHRGCQKRNENFCSWGIPAPSTEKLGMSWMQHLVMCQVQYI